MIPWIASRSGFYINANSEGKNFKIRFAFRTSVPRSPLIVSQIFALLRQRLRRVFKESSIRTACSTKLCSTERSRMPREGIEPSRSQAPGDFKSPTSTIPSPGHYENLNKLRVVRSPSGSQVAEILTQPQEHSKLQSRTGSSL